MKKKRTSSYYTDHILCISVSEHPLSVPILICVNKMKYQWTRFQPNQDKYLSCTKSIPSSLYRMESQVLKVETNSSALVVEKWLFTCIYCSLHYKSFDTRMKFALSVYQYTRAVMWRVALISPPDTILGFKIGARIAKLSPFEWQGRLVLANVGPCDTREFFAI